VASVWITRHRVQAAPGELLWNMHQAFEIEVVLEGRHERHFGDTVLELQPGDVSLASAWEPHGYRSLSLEGAVLVVFFLPALLGEQAIGDSSWLGLFVADPQERPRARGELTRRRVLNAAQELAEEVEEEGTPGWSASGPAALRGVDGSETYAGVVVPPEGSAEWLTVVRLGALRLLFAVARDWDRPTPRAGERQAHPRDLTRVAPAVGLVEARPAPRVSLEEAAEACGLSPSRFATIFRHGMGMSFGQFALRSRLRQAARLLITTEAPVEALAEQTGFGDASHLHHAFVKCYGCTPAAYRKRVEG